MRPNLNHSELHDEWSERMARVRHFVAHQCDGHLLDMVVIGRRTIAFSHRWHVGWLRPDNDNDRNVWR